MVDYLFDWIHNVLATLATLSGVGLLGYVALREFSPGTISAMQHALREAAVFFSGINLGPLVALVLIVGVLGVTLPQPRDRV